MSVHCQDSHWITLLLVGRSSAPLDKILSNEDSLDLIQPDSIVGPIIQLGRARRLVVGDLLRVLDCTTVLQVRRNACGPERMATGRAR
jgi:hypothetical protein